MGEKCGPCVRSSSEFCREGFPWHTGVTQCAGLTLWAWLSNPCHLQGDILGSNAFCLPYTHHFLHPHKCVVLMMTPLVQVSGDMELCLRACWSVHGLYLTQLQWNYWFTLVQKNLEWGPKTTGLCPNGPVHKVNLKNSVHSASNLLNSYYSSQ